MRDGATNREAGCHKLRGKDVTRPRFVKSTLSHSPLGDRQTESNRTCLVSLKPERFVPAQRPLGVIVIEAANKNSITMVVRSSTETVFGFDYGHGNPPYYVSKGISNEVEPVMMTCYLAFAHHTEFPRKFVIIPVADGVEAVKEFIGSGELPTCNTWEEV